MAAGALAITPRTAEAGEAIHPTVVVLDLTNARTDVQFGLTGSIFYAIDANNDESTFSLKFDAPDRQGIPILKGTRFRFGRAFRKLFISNVAQAGRTLTFLVAGPETFDIDIRQLLAIQAIISPVKSNVIIGTQVVNVEITVLSASSTLLRSVPAGKIESVRIFGRDAFEFFIAIGGTALPTQFPIQPATEHEFVLLGPLSLNAITVGVVSIPVRVLAVPLN